MTNPRPTIFIVEDSMDTQLYYEKKLKEHVTIVSAQSLAEADEKWGSIQEVAVVVMDACVDNPNKPDTIPLIHKILETFSGPIIAASSSHDYRKYLMRIGCSHEANKMDVSAKVLALLGLPVASI